MADPFSVLTGALTVVDLCARVGGYLRSVLKTTKHLDREIESLESEINRFSSVYTALQQLCATDAGQSQQTSRRPSKPDNPSTSLWNRAAELVQEGQGVVDNLRNLLISVLGSESSPRFQKIDDLQKAIKLLSKNKEYSKLCRRFTNLNLELNTMFTAIDLVSNSLFHSKVFNSLEQIPGKLSQARQELGLELKAKIETLEKADADLEPSIISAKAAVAFSSLNEHFYVQKPDTSIWTGRRRHLETLKDAMLSPQAVAERTQKRFVIHGISGAGKTQFCCKFAQDYRESFWGIFWIDASSISNATESWKKIAKIGGKDVNEDAGKFWLSNLQSPWLLIIDGADNAEASIGNQFPSGDRGYILIATRNPRLRINATVGFLTLDKLEADEAEKLLRKTTKHEPWDSSAKASALSIAQHLGYLPLALIHAGRAIFHQLCTLHGYIPFFNSILNSYRVKDHVSSEDDDDDGMGVFTSFDIIYSGLEAQTYRQSSQGRISQDAIELINVFSFLHNNDIGLDILIRSGHNLRRIATGNDGSNSKDLNSLTASIFSLQRLRDVVLGLRLKFKQTKPVFPALFQGLKNQPFNEPRARKAIDLLVRMSLLSESSESGSYSMHPLVHLWVRKRLSVSAQALWCGSAADILSSSIKIPPMADEPGDLDYHIRILKHVNQVQLFEDETRNKIRQNCQEASYMRSILWMGNPLTFTTRDAINSAKYSRIYMECSLFEDAERLQRLVLDFIVKNLGENSLLLVPISVALSGSLWHLGRASEAQELQETALRICRDKLGPKNQQTLKIMDALGETYWQRGWLKEAKELHQSAIRDMEGNPDLKRDQLKAMIHLGRVHEWYMDSEVAQELYEKASHGLAEAYGAEDFDALMAKDSLAMLLLELEDMDYAKRAHNIMQFVYETRLKKLGEEHIYTLWAACNLARTLTVRGSLENEQQLLQEAKTIFYDGLAISRRNLGPNHIGTLMGRGFLANVLVAEKSYDEAIQEYKDIAERQKYIPGARAGSHRDRLVTIQRIVGCYETQGKLQEAAEWCTTITKELDDMGGHNHPLRRETVERREKILIRINASADEAS